MSIRVDPREPVSEETIAALEELGETTTRRTWRRSKMVGSGVLETIEKNADGSFAHTLETVEAKYRVGIVPIEDLRRQLADQVPGGSP